LLSVTYVKTKPSSAEWRGVQQTITASLSSVELCLHQDALLDLAAEAAVWMAHVEVCLFSAVFFL
jgi:hypothetical protein